MTVRHKRRPDHFAGQHTAGAALVVRVVADARGTALPYVMSRTQHQRVASQDYLLLHYSNVAKNPVDAKGGAS
jgi:hypothetical protein